jgi:hypothetical protein
VYVAQIDRFRYILSHGLSHGLKEGLVAHAQDWPGVHCVRELLAGEPIRGLWFNRTAEYAARNRGEGVAAILRQHPHTRPSKTKKSPVPFYHAATKAVRKAFWQAYSAFV